MIVRLGWSAAILMIPALLLAQTTTPDEAIILFKDGFVIKGKVKRKYDFITDPGSGASFRIPAGNFYVDDRVRQIYFAPAQVQDIVPFKTDDKDRIVLLKSGSLNRSKSILPGWSFTDTTAWDHNWRRNVKVTTQTGKFEIVQRVTTMTPRYFHVHSHGYDWDQYYLTAEVGPIPIRDLLEKYHSTKKDMSDQDKVLFYTKFYHQAGWPAVAERELSLALEKWPEHKEKFKLPLDETIEILANKFAENIEVWHQHGQHKTALERLAFYDRQKIDEKVSEKNKLLVSDWKVKYRGWQKQFADAKAYLEELPKHTKNPLWPPAAKVILEGLSLNTVGRLETFMTFAEQHVRDLKEDRKPAQTTDQVMALAVTSWNLGNSAAEADPIMAKRVLKAREFLQKYLTTESAVFRGQSVTLYNRESDLPIDVLVRILRNMPPVLPHEKIDMEPQKIDIDAPEAENGSYMVLLPPEYDPYRTYPVVVLLQSPRDNPKDMLGRWQAEAAKHGYILLAPLWVTGFNAQYKFTGEEHAIVLDTLRDARRKFNIDSDRVFLFGWERGGDMAYDVGLSHPDQFSGVMPMNGTPKFYSTRYWPNAQYLPFYVVEGDRNTLNVKGDRNLFKDWIRCHYPAIYVEYKGRSSEWFQAEMANMLEWANRKKRAHPTKEMGRYYSGSTVGEEFRTMRQSDNRFYWLSTDSINDRHLNDPESWVHTMPPATLQASIALLSETDSRGTSRIWNQVSIRTLGVKQATLWLEPNMVDFTKPVLVKINGSQLTGGQKTLTPNLTTFLEELYKSGDRQRIFYYKIDIKL